jgi:transposase-like protein
MARKEQGIGIVSGWQEGLGGEDFLRDLVQRTVQQVLEAEMTSFLGAEAYHCNDVRRGGSVVSQGVLVAIGISAAGYREVLGCWVAESESEASWGAVFLELKQRGLRGVSYVVSDDHAGMVRAIEKHFQGAVWQRCQVHFVRNALSLCGRQQRPQVLRLMKLVTESATREAAQAALAAAIAELVKKAPKVARLLEEHGEEILGVYALPEAHQKRMRTTNMLERQNQELKRRTRVVRVFPHEQSCLRLIAALLMETNQEWMGRIYPP